MALTQEQQAIELLTRAKRVLVVTKEHATPDVLSSAVAFTLFLNKQKKHADAVAPDFDASKFPSFLPKIDNLRSTVGAMRAFLLSLDVKETPLGELMYDVKDGKLEITVVPKSGEWTPKDVSFKHGEDRYDLVVALDCPDMNSLGAVGRDHADFIYRTPVINIDRDPGNEHWGQLNLVDLTAVSTTEVLFGFFDRWNRNLIDEQIATALLAGMIAKTQSFRTANVTPKTLQIASQLVSMGARREEIVHGLWRTKSVPTLKLWGRALSRLEQQRELGIVWTSLSRQDFLESGTENGALEGVVNELISYAPEAKIVVLLHETNHAEKPGIHVTIHVSPPRSAQEIGRAFGANGARDRVEFDLTPGQSLVEGAQFVVKRIADTLNAVK